MQRRSVDLPEPDGPMMQTTSPFSTEKETSWMTSSVPKDFLMLRSSMMLIGPASCGVQASC